MIAIGGLEWRKGREEGGKRFWLFGGGGSQEDYQTESCLSRICQIPHCVYCYVV